MTATLHLIAHIGGHGIAVAASDVDSVVDIGEIVPVPRGGDAVLGIAALRSRVVTILDSWALLTVPRQPTVRQRAIVTRVDGHDYAIPVDGVEDIASFEVRALPTTHARQGNWGRAARGLIERNGEPVLVLSLPALVACTAAS